MNEIQEVLSALKLMESDNSIPKNVRLKVKAALTALEDVNGKSAEVKVDKALQELDELSGDPNIPAYTRTQIWSIVSALEGLE